MIQINTDADIWKLIEDFRRDHNLKKDHVAMKLGISVPTYYRWLKGEFSPGKPLDSHRRVDFIVAVSKLVGQPIQIGGAGDND